MYKPFRTIPAPIYVYDTMKVPNSLTEVEELILLVDLEIKNIEAQLEQRKLEVKCGVPDNEYKIYLDWQHKALSALRVKTTQASLYKLWEIDNRTPIKEMSLVA